MTYDLCPVCALCFVPAKINVLLQGTEARIREKLNRRTCTSKGKKGELIMAKENRGKWKHVLKWLMQERKKKTTFHSLLLTLYGTPTICPTVGFQFSTLE